MSETLENARVRTMRGYESMTGDPFGMFILIGPTRRPLVVIFGDGDGWEHASVSVRKRGGKLTGKTPSWADMHFVKELFWKEDETVVQYHVPAVMHTSPGSEYGVEVLHLWRSKEHLFPLPPVEAV